MKLERYDEAVKVYEEAVDRDASNHDLRAALKNAKLELKKSKRKNYYKILGVEKVCVHQRTPYISARQPFANVRASCSSSPHLFA
jgi:hypothetical protein